MNQRKPNRKAWYSLGLMMLLCICVLVVATGTTFARYRAERERTITVQVRKPEQIHLGTVSILTDDTDPTVVTEEFVPTTQLVWKTDGGVTQLEFAIANGVSELDHSTRDQKVQLRMIGTLGNWTGTDAAKLSLTLPPEEDSEEESVIEATVTPLIEGTALYHTYGEGWLYTFLDEEEKELFWELPGGQLSYVSLTVTINGEVPSDLSLLQPYVISEVISE